MFLLHRNNRNSDVIAICCVCYDIFWNPITLPCHSSCTQTGSLQQHPGLGPHWHQDSEATALFLGGVAVHGLRRENEKIYWEKRAVVSTTDYWWYSYVCWSLGPVRHSSWQWGNPELAPSLQDMVSSCIEDKFWKSGGTVLDRNGSTYLPYVTPLVTTNLFLFLVKKTLIKDIYRCEKIKTNIFNAPQI
jgi:hypothetical protein